MGGSQGSGVLNEAVTAMLDTCAADRGLAIRHAVGERFLAGALPPRDGRDGVLYQPVGYEEEMAFVYAAADLFVGRGGASTVHEVAVTGVPAILVPWSGAAEDHQTANVSWLAEGGAAVLLPERRIDDLGADHRRAPLGLLSPRGAGWSSAPEGRGPPQRCAGRSRGSRGSSLIGPCPFQLHRSISPASTGSTSSVSADPG